MSEYGFEFGDLGNPGLSSPTRVEVEYSKVTDHTWGRPRSPRQYRSTSETQVDSHKVRLSGTTIASDGPETTIPHPLRSARSGTSAESLANMLDLARRNHELSAQVQAQAQASDHSVAEKSVWKKKYDMEVESGKEKQAEIDRLRQELESTRMMVSEEKQKNWELQYDLQDVREEVSVLERRLMRSIPARLQGQVRDDEDDDNTAGAGFSTGLPWEKYENATIKGLKDKLRLLKRDRDNGQSRH